jgi:ATP-dependent protease ClpP protease subunit
MTSDTASMFIFSEIGAWGIDGQQFANEIEWLGRNGITTINVHINSGGGSVIDGLSILRSMQLFDGIINTHVEGVAASIAGVLAMGGKTRSIVDFGRIMIHDPSFSGNEALDEKQQKAVDAVRQMLIVIFDKNTTMTTDEISSIMTAETWFDAAESLSRGLVDKVIDTERKFENIFKGETNVAAMVNRATTIYNKPNTEIQKRKMINLTSHLKLAENAAETAIIDAVKVIEENAAIVDGKLNDANATIAANATEITSLKKVVATADVDKAITAGQIKKESRAAMIELAIENQKAFNAIVENVPVKAAKIMDLLNDGKPDADLSILINGKSFRELEKTDNALLNRIEKEDVKMFNKMYFNQYGVKHPNDVEK